MPKYSLTPKETIVKWIWNVTTKPNKDAYEWHGKISIFAWLGTGLIVLGRLISPLQWLKLLRRKMVGAERSPFFQERLDVHSLWTDIYFISILAISATIYTYKPALSSMVGWKGLAALYFFSAIEAVLLAESIAWVFYYTFLRSLFERRFSIYGLLEYFSRFR